MPRSGKPVKHPQAQAPPQPEPSSTDNRPLFFYMPNAKWGEYCQWYACQFVASEAHIAALVGHPTTTEEGKDDIEVAEDMSFNCAEQFMMYCKAARFNDAETQRRIMATDSPKEQKRLGKLTKGFCAASWDEVKRDVVVAGNIAKFGQNPKLGRVLLATGDRLLVEAASRDRVWGIGYSEKHAMSFRDHWGENLLGQALMVVRDRLRQNATLRDGYPT